MIKEYNMICPKCGAVLEFIGKYEGDDDYISIKVWCPICKEEFWLTTCIDKK